MKAFSMSFSHACSEEVTGSAAHVPYAYLRCANALMQGSATDKAAALSTLTTARERYVAAFSPSSPDTRYRSRQR